MASIFTKIMNGEIPSYKVEENQDYYAFLDIFPVSKGHTLVVPRLEVDYIFDLDDQQYIGLMLFAKKIAIRMKEKLDCKRVAIVVMGLEVPHAHIHLVPMNFEGDVNFNKDKLKFSKDEFMDILDMIAI